MESNQINIVSAPKTSTFQMRINPEVKKAAEEVYFALGLTLTDAVNIFIQQSLNAGGLPFLASAENREYFKAKAMTKLMGEIEAGWESAQKEGWIPEEEAYRMLGVSE